MLNYNEVKPGKYIIVDNQPCVVLEFNFLRMQQRKPVVQTKLKNLISGKTLERSFQQSDKFEEAEIETKPIKYLYNHRNEFWFCPENNPAGRFKIDETMVGEYAELMKPNLIIDAVVFDDKIIGVKMPVKVELRVMEAPPSTKGNTAQGGTKQVKLETGANINVPLFIKEGDVIRINTETKQYVERV
jgi:elongation factor P